MIYKIYIVGYYNSNLSNYKTNRLISTELEYNKEFLLKTLTHVYDLGDLVTNFIFKLFCEKKTSQDEF